ncbi:MAG: hypothetical protein M1274_15560 [Actinobacteria bacterium]|nr:hypothetical protein [Actinomycetota bacterium]
MHTAFTSDPEPVDVVPRRFRRLLISEARREEDRAALASLGAKPVWLGFSERAALRPEVPHFLGFFSLPRPPVLSHFRNLAVLRAEFARLASLPERPIIAAPLGVGAHVDHVEIFLASFLAMRETRSYDRFLFYEDAYTMSARARRRHFLASRQRWPLLQSPALAGIIAAGMLTVIGWAERGPMLHEFLPEVAAETSWEPLLAPIAGFEETKLSALGLYPTQMAKLGGYRTFSAMVRRWHRVYAGAERLWRASPCSPS